MSISEAIVIRFKLRYGAAVLKKQDQPWVDGGGRARVLRAADRVTPLRLCFTELAFLEGLET